jgi:hypothetical protein
MFGRHIDPTSLESFAQKIVPFNPVTMTDRITP